MAESNGTSSGKKLIRIDISSDSVCPWCFVGKRNLDKAISATKDQFDFQIKWHPFFLNPSAPKEGVNKKEYYKNKFGSQSERIEARTTEAFKGLGLEYDMSGLTFIKGYQGKAVLTAPLENVRGVIHWIVTGLYVLPGNKALICNIILEELFLGYFTQGKYIGDRKFLVESAKKVGIEGAAEFLEDPNNGLKEVNEELEKYSAHISGVPYYVINGKLKFSGGQPPEVFLKAFETAAN